MAVYVHKDNPLDSISLEELAEIYGEGGRSPAGRNWASSRATLGNDTIIRVSRQNSSGTYVYFREAVMGKHRRIQAGLDRPERFGRCGGAGGQYARRDRL